VTELESNELHNANGKTSADIREQSGVVTALGLVENHWGESDSIASISEEEGHEDEEERQISAAAS